MSWLTGSLQPGVEVYGVGGQEDSGGVSMKIVVLEACMQRERVTDTGHAECYLRALTPLVW